jgi:glycosyltransferase involved in cell wall biosynthesis
MLRVVQLNLAFDARLATAGALLDAYHTLTGWARAMTAAGARVLTVQRFTHAAELSRGDVAYRFVVDGVRGVPRPWDRLERVAAAIAADPPDVVHVNGLMFPGAVQTLRARLPRQTAIVLQDHSGALPRALPWPLDRAVRARWRRALAHADACSFTDGGLADRWHRFGLTDAATVLEIAEASTDISAVPRAAAVERTGITADPALLWVGRLTPSKDPLTLLHGLARARAQRAGARCWMIFDSGPLEPAVREMIASSPALRDAVIIVGAVPHERIADYYTAADVFVSASRHEGSGYALIEAMACGATPCVTDIPAFRQLTGPVGARWAAGDADSCAAALRSVADAHRRDREAVRRHFEATLDWRVIGRRTFAAYAAVASRRRT